MRIATSVWRKLAVTGTVAVAMVFLYEASIPDSRSSPRPAQASDTVEPALGGTPLQFTATAYCKGQTTASGVAVRTGIAAADPQLLPVGTVVRLETPFPQYDGIWTIMDTGPAVQGRIVDLYIWSCYEALDFGRQPVTLTVLRLGWNPQNSAPGLVDALFRKRERERVPVRPVPPQPPPIPSKPVLPVSELTERPQ